MIKLNSTVTDKWDFYKSSSPTDLIGKFGSPLYVYSEEILRERCRELKTMCGYKNFKINYSCKANTNIALLRIIREEGLDMDAMSPGEIIAGIKAGFDPGQIFFVPNNVSRDELIFAAEKGIKVSVDSLSQLELYGKINPGGKVCVRFNPGVGAGHHAKVVTGGKRTKFGVNAEYVPEVKELLARYGLRLIGINQHIGSLFMEADKYYASLGPLFDIAKNFDDLEFIDLGGGFGIPYRKQEGEPRFDLRELGGRLDGYFERFNREYGKELTYKIEPGRYVPAECGILLGTVHSAKNNGERKFVGTDLGFNVLARPVMYDSHHEVEIYRASDITSDENEIVSIVGNICESGDVLCKDKNLPRIFEDDIIGVLDAGAYGYVMASNYNGRLRPAEVLIRQNGEAALVTRRETYEDLFGRIIEI